MKAMKFIMILWVLVLSLWGCKKTSDSNVLNNENGVETAADGSAKDTGSKGIADGMENEQRDKDEDGIDNSEEEENTDSKIPDAIEDNADSKLQEGMNSKENLEAENSTSETVEDAASTKPSDSKLGENITTNESEGGALDKLQLKLSDGSTLTYTKHEISNDYQDETMLTVYLEYENKGKTEASASEKYDIKCYQDGKECEIMVLLNAGEEYKNLTKSIGKDKKLTVCTYFFLENEKDIELSLAPYDSPESAVTIVFKTR